MMELDQKALEAAALRAPGNTMAECQQIAEPIVSAYLSELLSEGAADLVQELLNLKAAFAAEGDNFGMEVSEAFHNAAALVQSQAAELAAERVRAERAEAALAGVFTAPGEHPLDEEELDTIEACVRNDQHGRILALEIMELVRVYRAARRAHSKDGGGHGA